MDNFGNLCLMSREKNSRYSNDMPEAKVKNYKIDNKLTSIKQRIMFDKTKDGWKNQQIEEYAKKIIQVLCHDCKVEKHKN